MTDLNTLSLDDLVALRAEKQEALDALFAAESPTDEQVTEAEALAAAIEEIDTAKTAVEQAAADKDAKWSGLKDKFSSADAPPEDDGDDDGDDDADDDADADDAGPAEGEVAPEAASDPETPPSDDDDEDDKPKASEESLAASAGSTTSNVKTLARRTKRPAAPKASDMAKPITITAAADVPGFSTGSEMDLTKVGTALQNRVRAFPKPSAAMRGADIPMQYYGVAQFSIDFPEDLTLDRGKDDMEVLDHAAKESRLPEGSLTAAGGWCTPSETLYDLCEGETLEGILSVPEVNIARGGINFTKGPQFSDFYGNGFLQTEAQAIAGDEKACYEIDCPPFAEVRMDAVGLCITVPILTNAAYPELTRRVVSGSLTAHQHWLNANVIGRIQTLSGAARVFANAGSSVSDALEALELVADQRRQQFRLALKASLEVVVPFWVKAVYRNDLGRRQGVAAESISDEQITAHFTARNLAVQFVYDWQVLDQTVEVYPSTYNALVYPAGTFVKGVADVINLSAVYDAASLRENVYTGTFTEQGLLVAEMCYDSDFITLPVCSMGRVGAADLTCA